jgi:hypothetical protein
MRNDLPSDKASNFNARLRETMMTYLGKQGDPLDRGVTLRDLVASGFVTLTGGRVGAGPVPLFPGSAINGSGGDEPDFTPPPTPTGFVATAGLSFIIVEHDAPNYVQGRGHLRTRLYGAIYTDTLPTFVDAVEIAQFSGQVYAHPTSLGTKWRLWAKWETVDNVLSASPAGGTNGVAAQTGLVGTSDLTDQIITAAKIADGSINLGGSKITGLLANANMAVITDPTKIADSLIGNTKLANLAVTAGKIADGSINLGGTKITGLLANANMAVITDPTKIADSLIGNTKLATGAVTAAKIADGSLDLGGTKVTGLLANANMAVITDPTKIADSLIGNAKLANLAVDAAKLANSAVTATKIANAAIGTAAIQNGAITNALIANAAIGSAQIANAAVTSAKIDTAAIGTANIQNGAITNALIANAAVGSAQIANAAITAAKIDNLAVGTAAIQAGSITTALIANLAVGSAQIADAAITSVKIGTAAIGAAAIQDLAVTNAKIANLAIDDAKIAGLSAAKITAGTIAADRLDANTITSKVLSVDWAKITNANVTNAQIANGAITTAKITDGTITDAKIANTIQSTNFGATTGWQINKAGTATFNQVELRGRLTVDCVGGNVQLGNNVGPNPGHFGLSLSHTDFNNIFFRRNDGVTFFRVNDGGANSLTFDSASGVLNLKGVLSAATGTFSGSLTAQAINAVNTINIAGNAVTVPVSAFTAGSVALSQAFVWETVQSVSITTSGSRVFVATAGTALSVSFGDGSTAIPIFRITRNGVELMRGGREAIALSYSDTPAAGTYTYALQMFSSDAGFNFGAGPIANNRSIFVIETKR